MRDMRDKLTDLIRDAIEQSAGLEMVTSIGKPTPRGGYDTTNIYAQKGTATILAVAVAWYPDSAAFDLRGAPVDQAPAEFWQAHRIGGYQDKGMHVFIPYDNGSKIDALLAMVRALLDGTR